MFWMKSVRSILLGLTVLLMAAGIAGCASLRKVKDIKVTSCAVESYSLKGLRAVDAVLALGIDNPAMAFKVTSLSGIIKYKGEDFAFYTADTLDVDRQCVKVYDLPCTATLSQGVTLMQVMQMTGKNGLEGFTTDIEAKVKLKNGAGKTLRFKDLDLQKLAKQ